MKNLSTLPAGLPDDPSAKLPATYENAQRALAECNTVDEAWEWQNKAAALAAYGRMARDKSLEELALSIRANAIYRAGELIRQQPSAQGERTDKLQSGTGPKLSPRQQAAADAGMSDRQRKTAQAISKIPRSEFDKALKSGSIPSITDLASLGARPRPISSPSTEVATSPNGLLSDLRKAADLLVQYDPAGIAVSLPDDPAEFVAVLGEIEVWCQRFSESIERIAISGEPT